MREALRMAGRLRNPLGLPPAVQQQMSSAVPEVAYEAARIVEHERALFPAKRLALDWGTQKGLRQSPKVRNHTVNDRDATDTSSEASTDTFSHEWD